MTLVPSDAGPPAPDLCPEDDVMTFVLKMILWLGPRESL